MDKADVVRELQVLPELLKRAEMNYSNALNTKSEIKLSLAEKESDLIRAGKINMKNEQTRQADLFPHLEALQKMMLRVDSDADRLKVEYHYLKNKLESIQLIAKLYLDTSRRI